GDQGQIPLIATNVTNVVSWDTNALQIPNGASNALGALKILNVDFNGEAVTPEVGFAATGLSVNAFWNASNHRSSITNLYWADDTNSASGVSLSMAAYSDWGFSHPDWMYRGYGYSSGSDIPITLSNLPSGKYDVYLYGHGAANSQNT